MPRWLLVLVSLKIKTKSSSLLYDTSVDDLMIDGTYEVFILSLDIHLPLV